MEKRFCPKSVGSKLCQIDQFNEARRQTVVSFHYLADNKGLANNLITTWGHDID